MIVSYSNGPGAGSKQQGFSLLEVLVAATVLSVGFSGLASLALQSLSASSQARAQSNAALLAGEMHTHIRLSPLGYSQWSADWQQRVGAALPGGNGLVCLDATPDDGTAQHPACSGNGPLVVKLFWPASGADNGRHVLVVNP
jgi:type IV pilus assembly protein PilV